VSQIHSQPRRTAGHDTVVDAFLVRSPSHVHDVVGHRPLRQARSPPCRHQDAPALGGSARILLPVRHVRSLRLRQHRAGATRRVGPDDRPGQPRDLGRVRRHVRRSADRRPRVGPVGQAAGAAGGCRHLLPVLPRHGAGARFRDPRGPPAADRYRHAGHDRGAAGVRQRDVPPSPSWSLPGDPADDRHRRGAAGRVRRPHGDATGRGGVAMGLRRRGARDRRHRRGDEAPPGVRPLGCHPWPR